MDIVLKNFKCKVTKQMFKAGEPYDGERTTELQQLGYVATSDNITEWPKHLGGGHYELSDGNKVKGKDAAKDAQAEIDASRN